MKAIIKNNAVLGEQVKENSPQVSSNFEDLKSLERQKPRASKKFG